MRKRSPVIAFILTWLTFVYFFLWMSFIMIDINNIYKEKIFDIKKKLIFLIVNSILYFGMLIKYPIDRFTEFKLYEITIILIVFLLAILWIITIIRYLRQISFYINQIEVKNNIEKPISKGITTVLSFISLTVIIYIQIHMNKVIDTINRNENISDKSKLNLHNRPLHGRF